MKYLNLCLSLIFGLTFSLGETLMAFHVDPIKGTCQIEKTQYPAIGFGTYPLKNQVCLDAVAHAAYLGYRIVDTATFYGNFEPISRALNIFGRHHFYLTSKVWPDAQTAKLLRKDLISTLQKLHTTYLDAYLVHWPNSQIPIEETLGAMENLRQEKLIRHIGLSNVTVNHLKRALEVGVPISWVQVEMNPFFYDAGLLEFCQAHDITVQAWAPLARGRVFEDPYLIQLGKKYGKASAQIAIKWILQHGCIPLPSSHNRQHIKQNFEVSTFNLTQEEMDTIDERAKCGNRERVKKEMGLSFSDEFDFSYEECWPKK